ncbi:MAG: hypothetical protein OXH87_14570, partial [Rhodospirillaceae bacterium]|nr:hypothetical protein [Rhodospirillaceae bacterium]
PDAPPHEDPFVSAQDDPDEDNPDEDGKPEDGPAEEGKPDDGPGGAPGKPRQRQAERRGA